MSNRGRPTLVGQREIEKTLKEYFLKGYSESATVALTGIGKNTVSKYFKKWHEELLAQENNEFAYRANDMRVRASMALDMQLDELYQIQDDLYKELEDYKSENNGKIPHGKGMYKERMNISESILGIIAQSHTIRFQRTDQEVYDSLEEEMVTKYRIEQKHAEEIKKKREEQREKSKLNHGEGSPNFRRNLLSDGE